jgi:hypothetical protein
MGLTAYPLGYALWLSFTNSDGPPDHSRFVGLDNYREAGGERERDKGAADSGGDDTQGCSSPHGRLLEGRQARRAAKSV